MSQLYYRRTDSSSYRDRIPLRIVRAESELSPLEKAYLGAVEKGDYGSVKQALQEAEIYFKININCIDPLGRTALLIAIENENLEIIELLLSFNVYVGDALLHAIRKEVVGAVELLLNHKKPSGGMQVPGRQDQGDRTRETSPGRLYQGDCANKTEPGSLYLGDCVYQQDWTR
uniref:Uncharacterized protein n=1 Tax=Knipowitschia caucasica TaxID=637954 RepID=A0AAV2J8F0_KNICA